MEGSWECGNEVRKSFGVFVLGARGIEGGREDEGPSEQRMERRSSIGGER